MGDSTLHPMTPFTSWCPVCQPTLHLYLRTNKQPTFSRAYHTFSNLHQSSFGNWLECHHHYKALSDHFRSPSSIHPWHFLHASDLVYFSAWNSILSQFSSIAQSCPTLCEPIDCSTPGLSVHHQLPEFTQAHIHWVSDAIQPSHPLSSPSPPAFNLSQHQGLSNESVLRIRWPKYWSFSFSISPSNEYSGLISFMMDWFDLLVAQGTLKSLLQHHSSKASILQHSTFFMVQLCCLQSVFFHWKMNSLKTAALFHSFLSSLCLGWHSGTSLKNKTNEVKRNRKKKKKKERQGMESWRI